MNISEERTIWRFARCAEPAEFGKQPN